LHAEHLGVEGDGRVKVADAKHGVEEAHGVGALCAVRGGLCLTPGSIGQ
jgi:hypothetical protein